MHTKQYIIIAGIVLVTGIIAGVIVKFLIKESFNLSKADSEGNVLINDSFKAPGTPTPKKS